MEACPPHILVKYRVIAKLSMPSLGVQTSSWSRGHAVHSNILTQDQTYMAGQVACQLLLWHHSKIWQHFYNFRHSFDDKWYAFLYPAKRHSDTIIITHARRFRRYALFTGLAFHVIPTVDHQVVYILLWWRCHKLGADRSRMHAHYASLDHAINNYGLSTI